MSRANWKISKQTSIFVGKDNYYLKTDGTFKLCLPDSSAEIRASLFYYYYCYFYHYYTYLLSLLLLWCCCCTKQKHPHLCSCQRWAFCPEAPEAVSDRTWGIVTGPMVICDGSRWWWWWWWWWWQWCTCYCHAPSGCCPSPSLPVLAPFQAAKNSSKSFVAIYYCCFIIIFLMCAFHHWL